MAFVAVITAAANPAAYADMLTGQASTIDGDTIEIHGQRIRLAGIDAPESRQACINASAQQYRCGQFAAFGLAGKIGRQVVICDGQEHDRYGRLIATCSAGGVDLNSWMVEQGLAVAYRRYATTYIPQEEAAKAARIGIWQGAFQMPWEWRKAH